MAMEVGRPCAATGWLPTQDCDRRSEEYSIQKMLAHGSISFGQYASSMSWQNRSVFNDNRRQEEVKKFIYPGLVAEKKAFFEEYFGRTRAERATNKQIKIEQKSEGDAPGSFCNQTSEEGKKYDIGTGYEMQNITDFCPQEISTRASFPDEIKIEESCDPLIDPLPSSVKRVQDRLCMNDPILELFSPKLGPSVDLQTRNPPIDDATDREDSKLNGKVPGQEAVNSGSIEILSSLGARKCPLDQRISLNIRKLPHSAKTTCNSDPYKALSGTGSLAATKSKDAIYPVVEEPKELKARPSVRGPISRNKKPLRGQSISVDVTTIASENKRKQSMHTTSKGRSVIGEKMHRTVPSKERSSKPDYDVSKTNGGHGLQPHRGFSSNPTKAKLKPKATLGSSSVLEKTSGEKQINHTKQIRKDLPLNSSDPSDRRQAKLVRPEKPRWR